MLSSHFHSKIQAVLRTAKPVSSKEAKTYRDEKDCAYLESAVTFNEFRALLDITPQFDEPVPKAILKQYQAIITRHLERTLDTTANIFINPNTPANQLCLEIARIIKVAIGATSTNKILFATLERKIADEIELNFSRYEMSSDGATVIDVYKCLQAAEKHRHHLLEHTHAVGSLRLNDDEANRVIHHCQAAMDYYLQMTTRGDKREETRLALRVALRDPKTVITSEYAEGWQRLYDRLYQGIENREQLTSALLKYPLVAREAFINNFTFEELSRIIIGKEVAPEVFKQAFITALRENKAASSSEVYEILYQRWLIEKNDALMARLEVLDLYKERDALRLQALLYLTSEHSDASLMLGKVWLDTSYNLEREFYDATLQKNEKQYSREGLVLTLTKSFKNLNELFETIKKYPARAADILGYLDLEIIKTMISHQANLVDFMVNFDPNAWSSVVGKLQTPQELIKTMLGKVPESDVEFRQLFKAKVQANAAYSSDKKRNNLILFLFNTVYDNWRFSPKQPEQNGYLLGAIAAGSKKKHKNIVCKGIREMLISKEDVSNLPADLCAYYDRNVDYKLKKSDLVFAHSNGVAGVLVNQAVKVNTPDFLKERALVEKEMTELEVVEVDVEVNNENDLGTPRIGFGGK